MSRSAAREPSESRKSGGRKNGATPMKLGDITASARAALEREADKLIMQIQPTISSFLVRDAVFKFMQQLIHDCFSDYSVRFLCFFVQAFGGLFE